MGGEVVILRKKTKPSKMENPPKTKIIVTKTKSLLFQIVHYVLTNSE